MVAKIPEEVGRVSWFKVLCASSSCTARSSDGRCQQRSTTEAVKQRHDRTRKAARDECTAPTEQFDTRHGSRRTARRKVVRCRP